MALGWHLTFLCQGQIENSVSHNVLMTNRFCFIKQDCRHAHIWKKHLKKSFSPEPRKLQGWILVYSIRGLRSTKFSQMMILEWPLTFLCKVKFANVQYQKKVVWHLQFYSGERLMAHGPLVLFMAEIQFLKKQYGKYPKISFTKVQNGIVNQCRPVKE